MGAGTGATTPAPLSATASARGAGPGAQAATVAVARSDAAPAPDKHLDKLRTAARRRRSRRPSQTVRVDFDGDVVDFTDSEAERVGVDNAPDAPWLRALGPSSKSAYSAALLAPPLRRGSLAVAAVAGLPLLPASSANAAARRRRRRSRRRSSLPTLSNESLSEALHAGNPAPALPDPPVESQPPQRSRRSTLGPSQLASASLALTGLRQHTPVAPHITKPKRSSLRWRTLANTIHAVRQLQGLHHHGDSGDAPASAGGVVVPVRSRRSTLRSSRGSSGPGPTLAARPVVKSSPSASDERFDSAREEGLIAPRPLSPARQSASSLPSPLKLNAAAALQAMRAADADGSAPAAATRPSDAPATSAGDPGRTSRLAADVAGMASVAALSGSSGLGGVTTGLVSALATRLASMAKARAMLASGGSDGGTKGAVSGGAVTGDKRTDNSGGSAGAGAGAGATAGAGANAGAGAGAGTAATGGMETAAPAPLTAAAAPVAPAVAAGPASSASATPAVGGVAATAPRFSTIAAIVRQQVHGRTSSSLSNLLGSAASSKRSSVLATAAANASDTSPGGVPRSVSHSPALRSRAASHDFTDGEDSIISDNESVVSGVKIRRRRMQGPSAQLSGWEMRCVVGDSLRCVLRRDGACCCCWSRLSGCTPTRCLR